MSGNPEEGARLFRGAIDFQGDFYLVSILRNGGATPRIIRRLPYCPATGITRSDRPESLRLLSLGDGARDRGNAVR
jgi:hypothetical protein